MGKTPLLKAPANGNEKILNYLLMSFCEDSQNSLLEFVRQADMYGQTPLQVATRKGHTNLVKNLLQKGSRPLHELDTDGKTVLHYAVQHPYEKAKELIDLLTENMADVDNYILFSASASAIGTAAQSTTPEIAHYVQQKKEDLENAKQELKQAGPLSLMLKARYKKMALEYANSGANVEDLRHYLHNKEFEGSQQFIKKLLDHIDKTPERGTDLPASEDSLGRNAFAEGLAALFLNPYVKSPFTVGIFGTWGMGKSSIMRQTENLLLKEASQLAFPDLLEVNSIPGSKQFERPQNCYYKKLRLSVKNFTQGEDGLVDFLNNYKEKHQKLYKFLALMDRRKLFAKEHSLAKIPSILTVWYNAWHYQKDMEAWAGLAVEITKAIEETMTTAQRIRVYCKYVWKQQRSKILLQLVLPFLLALVSACLVAWVAWTVLNRSKVKEVEALKYGSIPISTVVMVWTVVKQVLSVVKPISDQVMGYVQSNDHNENLGYQQKVIDDIEYLKNEIREEPCWMWKFMAWTWHLLHLRLFGDTVEGTWISKSHFASHYDDHLRIMVFVDDLDRCDDSFILQVLSAVNLVLATCRINVILGVDKEMLARAIAKKFDDNTNRAEDHEDLAEKYISKIIQLPLALPDPDDRETETFLKQQMGPALTLSDISDDTETETSFNEKIEAPDHVVCQCSPKSVGGFFAKKRSLPSRKMIGRH